MNIKTFFLVVFCSVMLISTGKSQVLDQAKLLKLLPAIPANLSTATDDEVTSYRKRCDSIYNILETLEEKYKRANSDEGSNTNMIMEYLDIKDSILDLHADQRNKYNDLAMVFSDLEFEFETKNREIEESIANLKGANNAEKIKSLNDQIYANKVECSEKQVAIYLQFLNDYKYRLNKLSAKANKSEVIPLPNHLNKNISYVLINVKNYLNFLSEVYRFNVGPNVENTWN